MSQRIDELLDAAVTVFGQRGYRATSMRDLADAVGLSKATLYHHIPSKEHLLVTLYLRVLEQSISSVERIAAEHPDPVQALRAALVDRVSYTCSNKDLLRLFFTEEHELPENLYREVRAQRRRYEDKLVELLDRAVACGQLPAQPAPSRLVVNTLLGGANWTYTWYDESGALSAEQLAEQVADVLLRATGGP